MLAPRLFVVGLEPPVVVVEPTEAAVDKQPAEAGVAVVPKLVVQVVLAVLAVEPQQFVVVQLILPQ